jgi:hypothetical protein
MSRLMMAGEIIVAHRISTMTKADHNFIFLKSSGLSSGQLKISPGV